MDQNGPGAEFTIVPIIIGIGGFFVLITSCLICFYFIYAVRKGIQVMDRTAFAPQANLVPAQQRYVTTQQQQPYQTFDPQLGTSVQHFPAPSIELRDFQLPGASTSAIVIEPTYGNGSTLTPPPQYCEENAMKFPPQDTFKMDKV